MGAFRKIGVGVGAIVGAREIKENWTWIREMAAVMDPRKVKREPTVFETFEGAVARQGLDEAHLSALRRNHRLTCLIAVAGLIGAWTANLSLGLSLVGFFPLMAFSAAMGSLYFRGAFLFSQVKARRLHAPKVWAANPKMWIPL